MTFHRNSCVCRFLLKASLLLQFVFLPELKAGIPDSLWYQLKTFRSGCSAPCANDTGKVRLLNYISIEYRNRGEIDSAFIFAHRSIELSDQIIANETPRVDQMLLDKLKCWKGNSLTAIGLAHRNNGNYPEAIRFLDDALRIYKSAGHKRYQGLTLGNIGNCYSQLGDYPRAMEMHYRSLKLGEEIENKRIIASAHSNLGLLLGMESNFDASLEHLQQGLKTRMELGDSSDVYNIMHNIANVYFHKKRTDECLELSKKVLSYFRRKGNLPKVASQLGNIGSTYLQVNDLENAYYHLAESKKIREKVGAPDALAEINNLLGEYYLKAKNTNKARLSFLAALDFARTCRSRSSSYAACKGLSITDSLRSDYKSAFAYFKMSISYRDSLSNEDITKRQTQTEMQYEFDKKEAEANAAQARKDAIAAEEKRRNEIVLWCVVAGLLLVAAFAVFILRAFRQKQKANIEISKQKGIIEEKQKEILDSIYYARRIQRALITSEKYIERKIGDLRRAK